METVVQWAVTMAPFVGVFVARLLMMFFEVAKVTFTAQGRRGLAASAATIDSALFLTVAAAIITNLSVGNVIAYAAGVGVGSWVGLWLLSKAKLGMVTVRVYVPIPAGKQDAGRAVASAMRDQNVGATVFTGEGRVGQVAMVLSTVKRRQAQKVIDAAKAADASAMVSVDNSPGPGSTINGILGPRRM